MKGEEEGGVFYFAFCSPTTILYFFDLGLSSCGNYPGCFRDGANTDRRRGTFCASPRLEARRITLPGTPPSFRAANLRNSGCFQIPVNQSRIQKIADADCQRQDPKHRGHKRLRLVDDLCDRRKHDHEA
jgi:hypothetical protein